MSNASDSQKGHRPTRISRTGSAELLTAINNVTATTNTGTMRSSTKGLIPAKPDRSDSTDSFSSPSSNKTSKSGPDHSSKRISLSFGSRLKLSDTRGTGSRDELSHKFGAIGKFLRGTDLEESQIGPAFGLEPSDIGEVTFSEGGVSYQNIKGKLYLTKNYLLFFTEEVQLKVLIGDILGLNKKGKGLEIICVNGTWVLDKLNVTKVTTKITEVYPGGWEKRHDIARCIQNAEIERLEEILRVSHGFTPDFTQFDEEEGPPLHAAIRTLDSRIIDPILRYYKLKDLDINIQDNLGWSVLHTYFAAASSSVIEDDLIFKLLNHPGINANVANRDNNTVLHYFCQKTKSSNAQEIAEQLLKVGADINKVNTRGESALHYAVLNSTVRIIIVKTLIEKGIKVNIQNNSGETALHYALHTRRKDLIKILLKASADVSVKSITTGQTPLDMAQEIGGDIGLIFRPARKVYDFLNGLNLGQYCGKFLAEDFDIETIAQITPEICEDIFYCLRIPLSKEVQNRFLNGVYHLKKTIVSQNPEYVHSCEAEPQVEEETFEEKLKKAKQNKQRVSLPSRDITNLQELITDKWSLKYGELELLKKVGTGASGKVFKGLWNSKGEAQKVAIKILKAKPEQLVKEFKDEFLILSAVHSDNIIQFYGATVEPKVCMVMEYCSFGSLYSILNDPEVSFALDWKFALKTFFGISAGVHAFHNCNPQIFHRDIKSLNILVDENRNPKLADFGEARFSTDPELNEMAGTVGWSAPELFGENPSNFTEKSDIYSMGILFWEVAHRISEGTYSRPFGEFKELQKEVQILSASSNKKVRPSIPKKVNPQVSEIICACWSQSPANRPTALVVLEKVELLIRDLENSPEKWRLE